jgi:hypothetical protein
LTGRVTKLDRYPFESGGVADIYQGILNYSQPRTGQFLYENKPAGPQVAVKIFRRMHSDPETLQQASMVSYTYTNPESHLIEAIQSLYEEARIWRRLKHPNILPFLGISLNLGLSPALISPFCASGPIMKYLQHSAHGPQERLQMV